MTEHNEKDTTKETDNIDNTSSSGHDGISNIPLKQIFNSGNNQMIHTGIIRDLFKLAKITPLFKRTNKYDQLLANIINNFKSF